jgi:hypothetical protein
VRQFVLRQRLLRETSVTPTALSGTLVDEVASNLLAATHPTGVHDLSSRGMVDSLHPHFHAYVEFLCILDCGFCCRRWCERYAGA